MTIAHDLEEFLNHSPASLLEAARAQVHAGNLADATHKVQQFVQMGQLSELLETSAEFAPLRQQTSFADILKSMQANQQPVSLGTTAFPIPDASLLPEDIDYDPGTNRFLITSVREKKIVSVDQKGSRDFALSADNWPMLAIKVDSRHGVVWATEVALQAFVFAPQPDWGRSAVLCFDLKTSKLLRRVEGPRGSALGDMVLTPDGDVIVSDGEGGGVYRLAAKGTVLERMDNGDFLSPQTPAMHPDGKHVFVPDYVRGVAVLEIATKRAQWLSMEGKFALNGIDGLYYRRGMLIAVQNGTSPERVTTFTLDPSLAKIESERVIEKSTATLGDPTHGVIVGDAFYYIANSGWDVIDDHGNLKPGAKLSRANLMRFELGHR